MDFSVLREITKIKTFPPKESFPKIRVYGYIFSGNPMSELHNEPFLPQYMELGILRAASILLET